VALADPRLGAGKRISRGQQLSRSVGLVKTDPDRPLPGTIPAGKPSTDLAYSPTCSESFDVTRTPSRLRGFVL
jgi:hypothetical protein